MLCAAAHGAKVIIHHLGTELTHADAASLLGECKAIGGQAVSVTGDIALPQTAVDIVDTAVRNFGRLDVLISNAGICPFHSFLDMPIDLCVRFRRSLLC